MTTGPQRDDSISGGSTIGASTDGASMLELLGFAPPSGPPAQLSAAQPGQPAPPTATAVPIATRSVPIIVPVEFVDAASEASPGSRRSRRAAERVAQSAPANRGFKTGNARARRNSIPREAPSERVARARSRRAETIGSRLLSLGAMLFAGALAVGMSVPANAFGPSAADAATTSATAMTSATAAKSADAQSVAVAPSVTASSTARDDYQVTSWAQMLVQKYGTRDYAYAASGSGAVRWPFPYAAQISSGYGERASPCRGCSSLHKGIDFVPGNGAPVYAVAAGVVASHEDGNGSFGNNVIIDHGNLLGDGANVQTLYSHLQTGSSPLVAGQVVNVGDFIGLVGSTGATTGPNMHLEVNVDGERVDPFAWLKRYAG